MSTTPEAQYAQGDVVRAVDVILHSQLPFDPAGAGECERIMRETGEGNTSLWVHDGYLRTTVYLAQEIVRRVRIRAARDVLQQSTCTNQEQLLLVSRDDSGACHEV